MPQQYGQQAQTDPILPLTPGFAEPLTYDNQGVSPHQDTPYSDPQAEALPEEEVADSQAVEDQHKAILKEDHQETDS